MSILQKICLFISSFLPLYIMLIMKDAYCLINQGIKKINCYSLLDICYLVVLTLLIIISVISILNFIFDKGNSTFNIDEKYEMQGDNIISYIMTYIVPLVSIGEKDVINMAQNIFLFIIIGIIYIQHNLLYLNPILSLFNYKFYKGEEDKIILTQFSKQELESARRNGHTVFGRKYGDNFFVYKAIRKDN